MRMRIALALMIEPAPPGMPFAIWHLAFGFGFGFGFGCWLLAGE
jgi:hypothetical protein